MGKRLQTARQTAGLTQQQLCQKAGLSYSTLAKIERGAIKAPSIFTIGQIAAALGRSLDDLIGTQASPLHGPKNGIKFVYFDINGCLVRFFHRAFTRLSEDTGASPDIIETAFWHYNAAVCKGEISMTEFNKVFAKRIGMDSLNWEDYYMEAVVPIREMDELLKWVSEQYQVGLLSNIMPGFIKTMQRRHLLPKIAYSTIIDSSEVGLVKPDRKIYELAEKKAGCGGSEILFVDDSRSNLMAAEHLGWRVLWFDDYHPHESISRIKKVLED